VEEWQGEDRRRCVLLGPRRRLLVQADHAAERLGEHSLPSITLQPLFDGLETAEDRIFWKHYNERLSTVLTVEGEHKNAFRDLIVTVAAKHEGLMHSILSLSSKHIDYETPYGIKVLSSSTTSLRDLQDRSEYHSRLAMDILKRDLNSVHDRDDADGMTQLHARYGQILCLLLESMVDGDSDGAHRFHLTVYNSMIKDSPPTDPALLAFVTEFFQYHTFADELLHHPDRERGRLGPARCPFPKLIPAPRLLGVADGLFAFVPRINALRDAVRANLQGNLNSVIDYRIICLAAEIDAGILGWAPEWPSGDSRGKLALLYKQTMRLYLASSIHPPPRVSEDTTGTLVDPVLHFDRDSRAEQSFNPQEVDGHQFAPTSASTSCTSSPILHHQAPVFSLSAARRQSFPASGPLENRRLEQRRFSESSGFNLQPAAPPGYGAKMSIPLEECLSILADFNASDPCQALLLIPCLIVGTMCLTSHQRSRIRSSIKVIWGYRGMRNIDRVSELLEEVWRSMDRSEWAAAWDWQATARRMNLDFLCA
jgi:hypothetical protein